MSYLVLARKYRPKTFSQVVGQEHVTRTLANAFEKDRVHHAFLFCGPRGVGKTTLARILGKALNCEKGPTAEPCGECSACVTITDGSAVDYYEMDGASNRGIDSIRELTEAVRYQPAVLRKKVYVIDEVHMLTTEAFNALLKTLEEPPPHVCFVLATTEPHKIPNTILSRCQRYDFKLVPSARLSAHLEYIFGAESLTIDPRAISLLVRESGGSVRDALSLCDQVISYVGGQEITEAAVAEVLGVADRSLTRDLVGALERGDAQAALETVDAAVARGVDEVQLARAVVRFLRDLAVIQVAPEAEGLVEGSPEEREELSIQARAMRPGHVSQMFDRMMQACNELGETRQPRLVLDLALIEVAATEPVMPLGDLLERLGILERYLAHGETPGGGSSSSPPQESRGRRNGSRPDDSGSHASVPSSPEITSPGVTSSAETSSVAPDSEHESTTPAFESAPPDAPEARLTHDSRLPRPSPPTATDASPDPTNAAQPPIHAAAASAAVSPLPEPPFIIEPPDRVPAREPEPVSNPSGNTTFAPPMDMLAEWERVLEALARDKFVLHSGYSHAKLLSWDDRGLTLGFTPEFEMWLDPDHVAEVRAFLREHYQSPITVQVRRLDPSESGKRGTARSMEDIKIERARDEERRKREEVHAHPSYKLFEERFGPFAKVEIDTNV